MPFSPWVALAGEGNMSLGKNEKSKSVKDGEI